MRGSKDANNNDENNHFDKNCKKLLSAIEMKDDKVQDLQQKWRKEQFWKKLQKSIDCNNMKDDRVQALQQKQQKWWKQWFGPELQKFA